ncbi:MAG TPA: ParB/RepB/Spo0J family partition protein [Anaerolineales bacterium]|nr:ParB/RepB/Spo0J family partition protein [Anaerolineales bacterium]
MNTYPSLTNVRSYLSDKFSLLQRRAARASLWAKLTRKSTRLAMFPEQTPQKSPNRRLIGEKEICIEEVVGTLNRHSDFDHKFRPLKSYLRDRWVNVYLSLEKEGWSPIIVHKVGDAYYVEDGHHRLSVARLLGMAYIQAKVWEYPVTETPAKKPRPARCAERSSATVYATR